MKSQRGAAILTAMLTVVLVASLASASLWQQWRGVEVEAAERTRTQSAWILVGGLDMARLQLRIDYRDDNNKKPPEFADFLSEAWATPLEPMRLSAFLAADRSDALLANASQEAFLSGQITDLQSRLNVTNLVQGGAIDAPSALAFTRLFELLDLPGTELILLLDKLRLAQPTAAGGAVAGAPVAGAPVAGAPVVAAGESDAASITLWPQTLDQLAWFGLSARSIAVLRPFVTVLPVRTPVNLNTAPAEVIYACVEGFDLADAHRLVQARNATHLATLSDASKIGGKTSAQFTEALHSVSSRFFEVRGNLRIDQVTVQEVSVVQRDRLDVKTLSRQRVASSSPTLQ